MVNDRAKSRKGEEGGGCRKEGGGGGQIRRQSRGSNRYAFVVSKTENLNLM